MARQKSKDLKRVRSILFKWNRRENKRDFFWRNAKLNLFQFLMMELLLQKTRAETAEGTIKKFIKKYDQPEKVLSGKKREIKKAVESLGLQNQRTRAIYEIAKNFDKIRCAFQEGNKQPLSSVEDIKGIGHYIKNAVACFYLDKNKPVLDVNTSRVISRIFSIDTKVDLRKNRALFEEAMKLLPPRRYKKFNWILLDFGAIVCKKKPLCEECPLVELCEYYNT